MGIAADDSKGDSEVVTGPSVVRIVSFIVGSDCLGGSGIETKVSDPPPGLGYTLATVFPSVYHFTKNHN